MGFVQRLGHNDATFVTTVNITLAASATAGNTIIMGFRAKDGASITSVTDTRSNTWVVDVASTASGMRVNFVRTAMDGGTLVNGDVVTVHTNVSGNVLGAIMEYTGMAPSPLDAQSTNASGTGVTTLATGSTGTTVQASEIALSICGWNVGQSSITTPTGYTDRETLEKNTGNGGLAFAEKVLSATGTENPSWTWGGSAICGAAVATYKLGPLATSFLHYRQAVRHAANY